MIVGDLEGTIAKILANVEAAKDLGADIVTFPELAISIPFLLGKQAHVFLPHPN